MLRKLLIGLAGLVGIIIIGLFALPAFISPEAYKPQIEKAASDSLGREVTIGAITKIAFLPNPKFTAENLVVANAPVPGPGIGLNRSGALRERIIGGSTDQPKNVLHWR